MPSGRPLRYVRADVALFANIPKELRDRPQWVVWRVHPREDGKPAKVPYDAKQASQQASVTNPQSWSTYDRAVKTFTDVQNLAGLGFVFTSIDPYTGVDIDDCRDSSTGELADWGQAIVAGLDSYTEVSPSGTGVKILVRASAPGTSTRRNKVEIYSTARYFTITGDVLLPGLEVQERQQKLDELYQLIFGSLPIPHTAPDVPASEADLARKLEHIRRIPDTEILELAMGAANGAKFTRLYDGNITDCGGDHSRADLSLCCILAYWTRGDTARVDRLFRASKLMRPKWNERRGAETYGQRTLREAVTMTTVAYDPEAGGPHPTRNDLGNADIFIRLSGDDFRYVKDWRQWISWDGVCWRRDAAAELRQASEKVPSILLQQANELLRAGHEDAPRAYKWALNVGEARRINSMQEVLQWRLGMEARLLDKEPLRLAVGNGVLDLKDASITEGKRLDWLTRGTSVRYEPSAQCPRFDAFMREIMEQDEEMVEYLWRVMGYCLTGDTSERAFFILHGEGKNGKTTFVEVLHALLDRYAQVARFSTFLRKNVQGGGANDDIAHLAGARVVIASEADEAQSLDAATVKTLTGSDSVRARFLYSGEFEFKPNFKLLLVTNHVPRIHEASHALWDRLHYIPFTYRVAAVQLDKQLGLKLLGELEGILARAVEYCLTWQREGLRPPQKVIRAVDELREDMDPVGEFIAQSIIESPGGKLIHARLYDAYQSWCRENGMKFPIPSKQLMKRMKSRGWECVEGHAHQRVWTNLKLRGSQEEIEV
jgi:putative DNA primase/helicase